MSRILWLATHLYSWLIRLYPSSFREEFEAEMLAMFAEMTQEVEQVNKTQLITIFVREFRDLPLSLAREHWHSRTKREIAMTKIDKKPEWFFYPTWILLTTLCVPIAFMLSLIIDFIIESFVGDFIYVNGVRHITQDYLFRYLFPPIVGLVTGLLQYGLLRRYLPRMGWWVMATTGGWLIGVFLILISIWLNFWTYESFIIDWAFIVLGLSIGLGQWLLLRRRMSRASWWIVANVVGWGLLGLITGESLDQFGLLALGFLPTCVTAVMLGILLSWTQPPEPQGT